MIRRHSLADISSLTTDPYPFDPLGYPHNTYHNPNNAVTIYTLRRASSPVMLPTARTTVTAPAADMPEIVGEPEQPKSVKKKNKKKAKKKANSRNNNKGERNGVAQGGVDGVEGNVSNNASMPLIVNGASLKHRIDQMSGISTEVCRLVPVYCLCGCVPVTNPNSLTTKVTDYKDSSIPTDPPYTRKAQHPYSRPPWLQRRIPSGHRA